MRALRSLACAALFLGAAIAQGEPPRPLQVHSTESPKHIAAEIFAAVEQPFAVAAAALKDPSHWCEILLLHLDTKDCRLVIEGGHATLSVGVVSKYDQPASSAYRASFNYHLVEETPSILRVRLDADAGPLGTTDYRILVEAAPVEEGRTSIHMSYSYSFGVMARIATQAYLATFGRNKVGFTVVGTEHDGAPRYIGGMRGVVERNTMRYYLAVEAWLDAMNLPPKARMEKSLRNWYAAIERYPRQLHEMDEGAYLAMKRNEFRAFSAHSGS